MHRLEALGWNSFFANQITTDDEAGLAPVRVVEEQRGSYRILGESGAWYAELSGRLRHQIELEDAIRPCVGDWALARVPAGDPGSGTAPLPQPREGLPDDDCHRDPGSRLRPLGRAA